MEPSGADDYHEITLGIDLTCLSDDFRRMLPEIGEVPDQIARELCGSQCSHACEHSACGKQRSC